MQISLQNSVTFIACTLLVASLASSCRDGLATKTKGGSLNRDRLKAISAEAPIVTTEIEGGINAARDIYQTRSTIVIKLSSALVDEGQSLSVVNETTGAVLIDHEPLTLGAGLNDSYQLVDTGSCTELVLKIYPLAQTYAGRMAYGANVLTTVVTDAQGLKQAKKSVTLNDFNIMGPSVLSFDPEAESSGYRLELSQNVFLQPVVSEQGVSLSTEVFNLINEWAPQVF